MRDDTELSKMFESISIMSTQIDVCPSKASDGSWTSKVNKDESKQVKSSKGISEYTNSHSMKLESSIINENIYGRIRKEQKSYIIECNQKSKMSISKIEQKLIMEYLNFFNHMKYNWYQEHETKPFSINNEKKRI